LIIRLLALGTIPLSFILLSAATVIQHTVTILTAAAPDSEKKNDNKSMNQNCIGYNVSEKTITIGCTNTITNLTDINNRLQDRNILYRQPNGVWLLNAGIVVDKGSILIIDSKDTKWLKIVADGSVAYPIIILGSLKIDLVKVTSWNLTANDYAISQGKRELDGGKIVKGSPRPYIRVERGATGTANITNSEIAYLGYEAGLGKGMTGITYLGGSNSLLRNNEIHDLYFGFYSNNVGGMVIENNRIYNNGYYGLDPHTRTHDMLIRNNTVHGNGATGIICSLDCSHITIENNKAYSNTRIGIMLSRNMRDSIVRNNIVNNETQGIFVSKSHNNQIYNNTVYHTANGIYLKNMSSGNVVHDNTIINPTSAGIQVNTGAVGNTFYHNIIVNPPSKDKAIVTDEVKNDQSATTNNETRNNQKHNIFRDNPVTL
jgi:poly(beta-D-mannuronate) C5 epimerase